MQHIIFGPNNSYEVAVLVKDTAFNRDAVENHYVGPLVKKGIKRNNIIGFNLVYGPTKKCPVSLQNAYLADLMPVLKEQGVTTILVADSNYFKTMTKERKADVHYGYVLPCALKGYTDMKVVLVPNYQALFFNPDLLPKMGMGITTLADHMKGTHTKLGEGIIHSHRYLYNPAEIYQALVDIKQHKELTCDVETLSLNFWETGIVTIAFAWDQHNGITIWCDSYDNEPNNPVREMLKNFFYCYGGTLIYHNANFDMKIIVNTLFMDNLLDEKGKQAGIEVITRKFHDTKIITYLATNSCTGNNLKLKHQAHEFAGNYAQDDINDITLIDPDVLVEYNLVDAMCTWFVFNKHYQDMINDKQLSIYNTIMKPSVKVILQVELTGMPIHMPNVKVARVQLEAAIAVCVDYFNTSSIIEQFNILLREKAQQAANEKLVKKVKPLSDFDHVGFNPNSNPNMQELLYEYLGFPVIDLTKSKAPATGANTLKKLINHTKDPDKIELMKQIIAFSEADKILGTFVAALEKAVLKTDGHYYLHGSFNIGGTVSGRLSSSAPNLQNIPSTGSVYAGLIKDCFVPPKGWLLMGADFLSLEDRISALTTKDTNKLKIYTDGLDGHCYRAFGYFREQMPDIRQVGQEERSFTVRASGQDILMKSGDFVVDYEGNKIAVGEYYDTCNRV